MRAYRGSVSKCCIKWLLVGEEEILDVVETLHLEYLWFPLNHLPVKHTRATVKQRNAHSCSCIFYVFSCMRNLCRAEKRLLGLSRTGPMGSMVPLSLTQWR